MSVGDLRKKFLDAVDAHVPEVLRELADIAASIPDEGDQKFDPHLWADGQFAGWCDRWGFTDSWLQHIVARNTAYQIWMGRPREWLSGQALLIPPGVPLEIASWEHGETELAFRKRAARTVGRYVKERKRQLVQSGLEIPKKRAMRQFDHLALVHVKGLSYKEVADWEGAENARGADENTIMKGVVATAAQIGLTLRTPPVGRPPKRKSGGRKG